MRAWVFLLAVVWICPPTWGDYGSVFLTNDQVVSGLIYDPNTGEFHLRVTGDSDLMLSDPAPIPGPVANIVFEYRTTFDRAGVTPGGSDIFLFRGGSIELTFDYDDGGGFQPYALSGRVQMARANWSACGAGLSCLNFTGPWVLEAIDLPGSNVWPDQGRRSTLDALTLIVPSAAATWDPATTPIDARTFVTMTILPDYGPQCCRWPDGDFDRDCDVDLADFAQLAVCTHDDELDLGESFDCLDRLDLDFDSQVDAVDAARFIDGQTEPSDAGCSFARGPAGGG
jgi:hypothetical protein